MLEAANVSKKTIFLVTEPLCIFLSSNPKKREKNLKDGVFFMKINTNTKKNPMNVLSPEATNRSILPMQSI